jgi:phosphoserine aminotransferase
MVDWQHSGMSVMESAIAARHSSPWREQAEADLRELMGIPANYKVLFLQGGATGQFADDPDEPAARKRRADYINTGEWSKKAIKRGEEVLPVNVVADRRDGNFPTCPTRRRLEARARTPPTCTTRPTRPSAASSSPDIPQTGSVPLVADMSSTSCRARSMSRSSA